MPKKPVPGPAPEEKPSREEVQAIIDKSLKKHRETLLRLAQL